MSCCRLCFGVAHPYQLLQTIGRQDRIRLFASVVLLEELAEALKRPTAFTRLALIGQTASQVFADYIEIIEVATPDTVPVVVHDDPDDDHVIAAALAAKADLIVSGDRHPLTLGAHAGIAIVSPAEALAKIA